MIAFLATLAWADPSALRAPIGVPGAVGGLHDLSVGAPVAEGWWLVAEVRTSGSAVGASAGRRLELVRGDHGWGADLALAAGLSFPTTEPSLAITATPAIVAGWFGNDGAVNFAVALPLQVRLVGGVEARLPALFEVQGGGRAGPVWIGARLGMGGIITPGTDLSILLEPGLWLALDLR